MSTDDEIEQAIRQSLSARARTYPSRRQDPASIPDRVAPRRRRIRPTPLVGPRSPPRCSGARHRPRWVPIRHHNPAPRRQSTGPGDIVKSCG